jgi:hypothetical protein
MINNRTPVIHHFLIGWLDDYRPDAMIDQYDTGQLGDREVDQNLYIYQRPVKRRRLVKTSASTTRSAKPPPTAAYKQLMER